MRAARYFYRLFGNQDNITDAQLRQFLFIYGFTALGVVLLPLLAVVHVILGLPWFAALSLAVTLAGLLNVGWLHRHRNVRLAENVVLTGLFTVLYAGLYGSIDRTGAFWFSLFPAAALFLKSQTQGVVAMVLAAAALVLTALLQHLGLLTTELTTVALLTLTLSMATCAVLIGMARAIMAEAEERLIRRSDELSREILQRHSVESLLRKSEEQMRFMAHRDPLTGLPNRALCYDRLDQALVFGKRYGHRGGVILIDLDEFSALNDRQGFAVGDRVLREVALRLQERVRASDTIGRIGIDEFLVIVRELDDAEVLGDICEQLIGSIQRPLTIEGRTYHLSASCGTAVFPDDAESADVLVECADSRLFRAKHGERGSREAMAQPS